MLVRKVSVVTGTPSEMKIDVTPEELEAYAKGGILLQDAFPRLNADEREFIKTGITPEEWNTLFGE